MSIVDGILQEFEQEAGLTRKVLERAPEEKWDWKPHEKSMSMGKLASHLAENPLWAAVTMNTDFLDVTSGAYTPFMAKDRADLLDTFAAKLAEAKQAMAGAPDSRLLAPWQLRMGAEVRLEAPRFVVLRMFVLNHTIHHRGQLTVYLRMNNVPLPSIYGPTADEDI